MLTLPGLLLRLLYLAAVHHMSTCLLGLVGLQHHGPAMGPSLLLNPCSAALPALPDGSLLPAEG